MEIIFRVIAAPAIFVSCHWTHELSDTFDGHPSIWLRDCHRSNISRGRGFSVCDLPCRSTGWRNKVNREASDVTIRSVQTMPAWRKRFHPHPPPPPPPPPWVFVRSGTARFVSRDRNVQPDVFRLVCFLVVLFVLIPVDCFRFFSLFSSSDVGLGRVDELKGTQANATLP